MRRTAIIVSAVLLVPVLAAVDHSTGQELNFFVFYYIPVALLTWYAGRTTGLGVATICAMVWYVVDAAGPHSYSHPALGIWNAGLRWIAFALIAIALARIRVNQEKELELNRRLAVTVDELQRSLVKIETLRNDVQIVCAWTNRIKSEGRWIKFEEFMAQHFQLRFTHGISAEGLRQLREEEDQARLGTRSLDPEQASAGGAPEQAQTDSPSEKPSGAE